MTLTESLGERFIDLHHRFTLEVISEWELFGGDYSKQKTIDYLVECKWFEYCMRN